jgi:hypothetical protein
MVRAILEGRKTQTRRVVKPQPFEEEVETVQGDTYIRLHWGQWENPRKSAFSGNCQNFPEFMQNKCPYGKPGDFLWVRETWAHANPEWDLPVDYIYQADHIDPKGDAEQIKWKPSIHMFRQASRITLEVTDIKIERLQDIGEDDAIAEGIEPIDIGYRLWTDYSGDSGDYAGFKKPVDSFRSLWDSINSKQGYGWEANPWCWAVSFKRIEGGGHDSSI